MPGTRAADVKLRIRQAVEAFQAVIESPPQEYECWIEVEGLRTEPLPAQFGTTEFDLLGDREIARLTNLVRTKHTVDHAHKIDAIGWMAGYIRSRPVAIERVYARDDEAAVSLAKRKISITLECLNFFADLIPYNRHRLGLDRTRLPTTLRIGRAETVIPLQLAVAADGSFWQRQEATNLKTFSIARIRELIGTVGEAVERVESLLSQEARSPSEELVLRVVRWVGRATAAESAEDKFLFSMIALECLTKPSTDRHSAQEMVSQIATIMDGGGGRRSMEDELGRLYKVRSELVHDGSREISDSDCDWLYNIALNAALVVLASPAVRQAETLGDLEVALQARDA